MYGLEELDGSLSLVDAEKIPGELWRLKNGDLGERDRFGAIRARFRDLVGCEFDLAAAVDGENLVIDPRVVDGGDEYPMAFAGAGRWEAIVVSFLAAEQGRVVVLDEPGLSLHPSLLGGVLRNPSAVTARFW